MKIFTIIKDNSERIPYKNRQVLGGKPLWRFSLEKFSSHQVFLNTDSLSLIDEISNDPSLAFVKLIRREQRHIDWESNSYKLGSPVTDMFIEFAKSYCIEDEIIALYHVTSPFLLESTLMKAIYILKSNSDLKSIHSVSVKQDVAWKFISNGNYKSITHTSGMVRRTQDLTPFYFSNGAFFCLRAGHLIEFKDRLVSPYELYPLHGIEAVEIDSLYDLQLARYIAGDLKLDGRE